MKKLITCLLTLIIFGCNTSDDELQPQNDVQNEITELEFNKMLETVRLENSKLNDTSLNKGDNSKASNEDKNNKGVYFVPIYSNDVRTGIIWFIAWAIPNSSLMVFVDFPKNGDDRALVFSENEFMANWTIHGPRVFIRDLDKEGEVIYSNHCDANKTGIYSMRSKAEYLAIDQNRDGETDIYLWGRPWQSIDKNFRMFVKTTLTDAHSFSGDCPIPTEEEVDFSFTLQTQNGRPRVEAVLDGVKYSL